MVVPGQVLPRRVLSRLFFKITEASQADVDTEPLSEDMGKTTNGSARGDGVMEGSRGNFRGTISLDCLTP